VETVFIPNQLLSLLQQLSLPKVIPKRNIYHNVKLPHIQRIPKRCIHIIIRNINLVYTSFWDILYKTWSKITEVESVKTTKNFNITKQKHLVTVNFLQYGGITALF
jgi:hypothetical protein